MDNTCRTKTVQSLTRDIGKNRILLSHKLQRKEGQWNRNQKSDLIDSLLRKYPVNPTYAIKENGVLSAIDGVQRLSTVRDYLADVFALSKTLAPVNINGEEKIIAGKKFSKLDEETQDALKASELQIYELTECTERDVREMFRRQNAGKALNSTQLRTAIESDEMADIIFSITSHPLFDKLLTKAQRKRDLDKDIARETLMLVETDDNNDYTSFKSRSINEFIKAYQSDITEEKLEKVDCIRVAMDKLDNGFEMLKVNTLTIPMMLYAGYMTQKEGKDFNQLIDRILDFVNSYDTNEEYKQFCQSGTSSSEKVRGRLDYWRRILAEIQ